MLSEIEGKNIAQRIITTNFKTNKEVLDYFTSPLMFTSYLSIVEATDIEFSPLLLNKEKINFPLKITYKNYPKLNFFPYKLPKTKIVQIWNKKNNAFVADINTDFLKIKISILPFIES